MLKHSYLSSPAPNFPSSTNSFTINVSNVTSTTASIDWAAPSNPPDADGYVIYYYETCLEDLIVVETQLISDSKSNGSVLTKLFPNTNYTVYVRAFQDILGPPTDDVYFVTKGEKSIYTFCRFAYITPFVLQIRS